MRSEGEVGALEKSDHRRSPDKNTSFFLPIAHRKEEISKCEAATFDQDGTSRTHKKVMISHSYKVF